MKNFKFITIGLIAAITIFAGGLLIGKFYFSKTDIKVVDRLVYKTKWKTEIKTKIVYKDKEPEFSQENFDIFYNCYTSPISFKDYTEKNYLFVTAYDDCKEAEARYEIGSSGNWKLYFSLGAITATGAGYGIYRLIKYFTK